MNFVKPVLFSLFTLGFSMSGYANLKFDGKQVDPNQLSPHLQTELYEIKKQNYRLEKSFWEEVLFELHTDKLAKKQGKDPESVRANILAVGEPTEQDLQDFYNKNRHKISYPFAQIKGELRKYVYDTKVQEKKQSFVQTLLKDKKVAIGLKEPQPPKFKINTAPFFQRGAKNSKVTLVEFADYKCPHCAEAAKVMEQVYSKYKSKVNFVFIDFPILKGDSEKIAIGAYCAQEQGKYWEFHKDVFNNQSQVNAEYMAGLVKKLGMNSEKWNQCSSSSKAQQVVADGKSEGIRLGLRGTPSFYINGMKYSQGLSLEKFSAALDQALR